ncbi:hypothetical protein GXM_07824 [Nostoc sphaeroides CCNUC1]|uniref:Uncharacterized protein n=1 Tax=Nostoc sphaeroides CCNUC1 TaxID=2653204 RepID=A0A5P8WCI6_9NOSO|nr:hypothetical protein GXM_07824 [Nostoc sphaeroides CCNUC1]
MGVHYLLDKLMMFDDYVKSFSALYFEDKQLIIKAEIP